MNKAEQAVIITEINRLYDAAALIAGAIGVLDWESQEGNEVFRLLQIAKDEVGEVANNLDIASIAK